MTKTAIIGGSGLTKLAGLVVTNEQDYTTPFGKPSAPIILGEYHNNSILFLARHGAQHTIPPHKINYRANIHALKQAGATKIIAVNAVGGITTMMKPQQIVIPHQLIDYTYGRDNTFYEEGNVHHIDFTYPYSANLREKLINAAKVANIDSVNTATHGITQGPRLETAAEVEKLAQDGCDIVGMTSMPEAALSRELEIDYACCALVVNWAAGKTDELITTETIEANLKAGLEKVMLLVAAALDSL